MKKEQNELIELIKNGPNTVNHGKGGAKENWCSNALPSLDVIVKGQWDNPNDSKVNAVLSLFNANTSKCLGKNVCSLVFLSSRVFLIYF
jgi:hypothetical protein